MGVVDGLSDSSTSQSNRARHGKGKWCLYVHLTGRLLLYGLRTTKQVVLSFLDFLQSIKYKYLIRVGKRKVRIAH